MLLFIIIFFLSGGPINIMFMSTYWRKEPLDIDIVNEMLMEDIHLVDEHGYTFKVNCATQMQQSEIKVHERDAFARGLTLWNINSDMDQIQNEMDIIVCHYPQTHGDLLKYKQCLKKNAKVFVFVHAVPDPNEFKIEVVEGSDILQYYSENSYFNENGDRGSLWDSCMRHNSCQDWFNIYTLNTGTVSLAVLKNDNNIIKGRAILWNFNGVSLMDRIYHYDESNEQIFKDWAVENKYHYKEEQNYCNASFIDYEDGGVMDDGFDIPLNVDMDWEFPYMDTFKYLTEDGVSSSSCDEQVGILENIDGSMKRRKRLCAIHGDYYRESDMTLITGGQYQGDYVYYEEARYCSSDGTQRVIDELTHVERNDNWYLHNDVVEVLDTDGKRIYYYVGDTVKNDAIGEILISRYTIEAVDGNRYYEKDLVYYTNIGHVYKHINQKPFVKLEKEIKSKLERAMSRKHDMLSRALELAKTKHQLQTTKTIALVS